MIIAKMRRETTLVLTLIDVEKSVVEEIAKDLCTFFHQESVLITEGRVNSYYISESLECDHRHEAWRFF